MHRAEEKKIAQELVAELPKGLIKWYPFQAGQNALYITGNTQLDHAVVAALQESGLAVDCVETDHDCCSDSVCVGDDRDAGMTDLGNMVKQDNRSEEPRLNSSHP